MLLTLILLPLLLLCVLKMVQRMPTPLIPPLNLFRTPRTPKYLPRHKRQLTLLEHLVFHRILMLLLHMFREPILSIHQELALARANSAQPEFLRLVRIFMPAPVEFACCAVPAAESTAILARIDGATAVNFGA